MNGPVDVLAWLDSLHATTADGAITNRKWPEAQEARAAVAELIDTAVKFRAAQKAVEAGANLRKYRRRDSAGTQLDIALARVGGAS